MGFSQRIAFFLGCDIMCTKTKRFMGPGGIIMATKKATKASAETAKSAAEKTVPEKTPTVKAVPAKSSANNKASAEKKVSAENKTAAEKIVHVEDPAAAPKKTEDKTAEAKVSAKKDAKPAAAKRTAAKKEIKVKTVVEYYGKQVDEKDIIADVKKAWTKSGKKVGDIKSIELYIKPEEAAVYYVINKTETGAVAF